MTLNDPAFKPGDAVETDARGSAVIDIGNPVDDGLCLDPHHRFIGDVDKDNLEGFDKLMITPVPGGVGPMTISMLLANTVEAQRRTLNTPVLTLKQRFREVLPT